MNRIFISYSHDDTNFMRWLCDALRKQNFVVWTDEKLEPGTPSWLRAIQEEIEKTEVVIAILSPSAKASEWVDKELFYATIHNIFIIPIMFRGDDKTSLPLLLAGTQYLDMRIEVNRISIFAKLVEKLRRVTSDVFNQVPKASADDYLSLAINEISKMQDYMARFGHIATMLGNKAKDHMPDYLLAQERRNFTTQQEILKKIGDYLLEYAKETGEDLPGFKEMWINLMSYMSQVFYLIPIKTENNKQDYLTLRKGIDALYEPFVKVVIPSINSLKEFLLNLEKLSSDLNEAVVLVMPIVTDLDLAMRTGASYLRGLQSIVDESVSLYDQTKKK